MDGTLNEDLQKENDDITLKILFNQLTISNNPSIVSETSKQIAIFITKNGGKNANDNKLKIGKNKVDNENKIKKKNELKKKKKDEDDDGPKRHERIGNLNYYSEEISKFMIEKIISLALSDDFRKNIEKKINNFCYDSMVKTFDNLTQLININHDIDDFDVDNIEIAQYIKYNKSDTNIKRYLKSKHNTAIEARNNKAEQNIMELAKIPKDFKTYMNIKNKKIEEKKEKRKKEKRKTGGEIN